MIWPNNFFIHLFWVFMMYLNILLKCVALCQNRINIPRAICFQLRLGTKIKFLVRNFFEFICHKFRRILLFKNRMTFIFQDQWYLGHIWYFWNSADWCINNWINDPLMSVQWASINDHWSNHSIHSITLSVGGFPIEIEIKISKLIMYSLAIFII